MRAAIEQNNMHAVCASGTDVAQSRK